MKKKERLWKKEMKKKRGNNKYANAMYEENDGQMTIKRSHIGMRDEFKQLCHRGPRASE